MTKTTEKRWVVMVDFPGGTLSHKGETRKQFLARTGLHPSYVKPVTLTYQVPK